MEYTLNPYQGCWHDCKYCDGKSERYYMHKQFGNVIRAKSNADELLKAFLKNKGHTERVCEQASLLEEERKKDTFTLLIGGGVCDVYQPAELEVRLMRKILRTAYDYGVPVIIVTKSHFVLEDMDLLKGINGETYAAVHFSLGLAEDETRAIFEPRASSADQRTAALKTLRDNGIHGGFYALPILPFIGDTDRNFRTVFDRAGQARAEFLYAGGLTLTPGRNKDEFLQTIQWHMPEFLQRYQDLYRNNDKYGCMDRFAKRKYGVVTPEVLAFTYGYESGVPFCAPRYIPKGRIEANLRLSELLVGAAYIKRSVLGDWHGGTVLYRDAGFIENYQRDIYSLRRDEAAALPVSPEAKEYMVDLFLDNGIEQYEQLRNNAYEKAKAIAGRKNTEGNAY
jgi:DNA repair photolyase